MSYRSTMPSLEDFLPGFDRGLLFAIKLKIPVRTYDSLQGIMEQAKLNEKDFIKSAAEDVRLGLKKKS